MIRSFSFTYAAFALRVIVPLILLPFLSSELGTTSFGAVLAAQSLAVSGCIVLEWGFSVGGVRDLSRARSNSETKAVVREIMSTRICLAPVVFVSIVALASVTPVLRESPDRSLATGALAVALGANPLWYFQGRSRPVLAAGIELIAALISLVCILVFVRGPSDVTTALLAMMAGPACSFGVAIGLMYRDVGAIEIRIRCAGRGLQNGLSIFLVQASSLLQTAASTWLIALLSTTNEAAFYGIAFRITYLIMASSFEPIAPVVLPHSVKLAETNQGVFRFALYLLAVHVVLAICGLVGVYMLVDYVINFVFSPDMRPAGEVTEVLALTLVPLAGSHALNLYFLIPKKKDANVAIAVTFGAIAAIALANLLVPDYGAVGMAWSRIVGETFTVAVSVFFVFRLARRAHQNRAGELLQAAP